MNKDLNKQTQTSTQSQSTSRSGGPIDSPPDIRIEKKSKSKNLIFSLALLALVGIGAYANRHTLFDTASTSSSVAVTKPLEAQIAQDLIAISNDEISRDPYAATNPDFHPTHENLDPETKQKILKVENEAATLFQNTFATEGILTKCHIKDHDVHFIDRAGGILSHVQEGQTLPPLHARAREIILANKNATGIAVVVKKTTLEVYNHRGELQAKEEISTPAPPESADRK